MPLSTGTSLGPYKILAPLGAGGMGEVYRAHDSRLGRDVAIKVLSPHLASTPEARARFEREARTISQLNHPHICTLFDVGHQDGIDYLVMELLEGQTLAQRLEKGPLPVADVLSLGTQIAEALDVAHRHGVVHRDLKPGNVMLTKSGAKLMDFGLAHVAGGGAPPGGMTESPTLTQPLTKEGTIVGTFQYMAPEQLEGKDADARSDIWALGCVLYEMATAKRAFEGASQASLISAIMKDQPRPITELQPLSPPALDRAVHQCLAKDPDERWQSSRDLARELAWIAEARPKAGAPSPVIVSSRPGRRLAWAGMLIALVAVATVATLWVRHSRRMTPPVMAPVAAHDHAEVAVLPFQNLTAEWPHAYFAGGLHDELLTQLTKVAALKVISRTSVMGYANPTKSLKQIGAELGVGSIVEGSVQVTGNRLRVNVQLIDAATDEHLWAEHYDRVLDDAFAIQSDVAQRIVEAVGATLAAGEREAITEAPTKNAEAYRLYLQGEEYRRRPGMLRENLESAQRLYERALVLDPGFAVAHARLSGVHGNVYWFMYDPSPARADRMRSEAEMALSLAPHLPQSHHAMGSTYCLRRDWRRGLVELRIALRGLPNDAELWADIGYAQRRLGNWAATDSAYQRAMQLDPRNAGIQADLGEVTYRFLRRYADAVRAADQALRLAPDLRWAAVEKGLGYVYWKGDLDTLRSILAGMPVHAELGNGATAAATRALLLLWERKADSLLALVGSAPGGGAEWDELFHPTLYAAWAHRLRGDERAARAAFAAALESLAAASDQGPYGYYVHAQRGAALAGLARKAEALEEVRWLRESPICREDRFEAGPLSAEARAIILAELRDTDAAVDEIERILAGPGYLTVHTLRLDPRWDPIRDHPRFKALLAKYADPEKWAVR